MVVRHSITWIFSHFAFILSNFHRNCPDNLINRILCVLIFAEPIRDYTGSTPLPRFTSRGQTFRVVLGDTLVLPCEVQDLGKYPRRWKQQEKKIKLNIACYFYLFFKVSFLLCQWLGEPLTTMIHQLSCQKLMRWWALYTPFVLRTWLESIR